MKKCNTNNQAVLKPCLTPKGIAFIAWINCGLAPEVDGGYDDTAFQKFWAEYEKLSYEYFCNEGVNND